MNLRKEKEGSTTSYGLWRYGNDFYNAAVTLNEHHHESAFMPFYATIGQSIELSLKAFLLSSNIELKELVKKYGHNLNKLISEACSKNIETVVKINSSHFAAIQLMSDEYLNKKYNYIKTGRVLLPERYLIIEAAYILTNEPEQYCKENTKWEYA